MFHSYIFIYLINDCVKARLQFQPDFHSPAKKNADHVNIFCRNFFFWFWIAIYELRHMNNDQFFEYQTNHFLCEQLSRLSANKLTEHTRSYDNPVVTATIVVNSSVKYFRNCFCVWNLLSRKKIILNGERSFNIFTNQNIIMNYYQRILRDRNVSIVESNGQK